MARRIVVHTDLSDASGAAVRYARALAESLGGTLQFLHVVQEPLSAGWTAEVGASALPELQQAMEIEAELWLDGVLPEDEQERFKASLDVETGDIAEEIVRYANEQEADIVVLSATANGGPDAADTSTAEDVVRKCRCSVFVVRP
jgi:nucleotide-binding universal stress UspA family protein